MSDWAQEWLCDWCTSDYEEDKRVLRSGVTGWVDWDEWETKLYVKWVTTQCEGLIIQ